VCRDVDECTLGELPVCGFGAFCKNLPGSFACECPTGYNGNPLEECVPSGPAAARPCSAPAVVRQEDTFALFNLVEEEVEKEVVNIVDLRSVNLSSIFLSPRASPAPLGPTAAVPCVMALDTDGEQVMAAVKGAVKEVIDVVRLREARQDIT
jgi:hypothetical protein